MSESKTDQERTLKIRSSQLWLIGFALTYMTQDHGIEFFQKTYPDMDEELVAEDIEDLMDRVIATSLEGK